MHLKTRNVNTAFRALVDAFVTVPRANGIAMYLGEVPIIRRPSRNGDVLVIDEPVTVTYERPTERVLFNAARDANPFFHLYEALWMLAGRNDVAPPAYYAKQMEQYSDDGKTLNGAYGYRWRHARGREPDGTYAAARSGRVDQLDTIVNHLKADPHSRRAVLQMWNVEDDLLKIGEGNCTCTRGPGDGHYPGCQVNKASKDVCCNLSVMFGLRLSQPEKTVGWAGGGGYGPGWVSRPLNYRLDMTVTNRSNDLVWGMLGANYVHFTVLQEYLAARLGVGVGLYHHFTNNLHAYVGRPDWNPRAWLGSEETQNRRTADYAEQPLDTVPLVKDPEAFERELPRFAETFGGADWGEPVRPAAAGRDLHRNLSGYSEPFLASVAGPALLAFRARKAPAGSDKRTYTALALSAIRSDDWREACTAWVNRRDKGGKT